MGPPPRFPSTPHPPAPPPRAALLHVSCLRVSRRAVPLSSDAAPLLHFPAPLSRFLTPFGHQKGTIRVPLLVPRQDATTSITTIYDFRDCAIRYKCVFVRTINPPSITAGDAMNPSASWLSP